MRIYHNIPALYAYNALNQTNSALQKSIRTLSTGLRINSAADDAAGLAISEKMRAQINGLNMAVRNAQDGVSMLQTAEGALTETHSILQRMRELAVQAANDTLTQQDRGYIQQEVDSLKDEINRIASSTQFNKKRLLDGSSSALWSSNNLDTKAYIRGSLRQIDQFGQKAAFEGNYKITMSATPGQAEAKKTDIFKIKHENVIMKVSTNSDAGVAGVRVDSLPAGTYRVAATTPSALSAAMATLTGAYASDDAIDHMVVTASPSALTNNASILFEVISVSTSSGQVTFKVTSNTLSTAGVIKTYVKEVIVTEANANTAAAVYLGLGTAGISIDIGDADYYKKGDKLVWNVALGAQGNDRTVGITGKQNEAWPYNWATEADKGVTLTTVQYTITAGEVSGQEVHFKNFYVNSKNGTVYEGDIVIKFDQDDNTNLDNGEFMASFEAGYIGQVAKGDVALRDLDKFWNSQGVFMLNDPQTITISQGDGKSTKITLYSTDTLEGLRSKINDAIGNGLGQSKYAVAAADYFATFVEDPVENTLESVAGTFVIRSMVAGSGGVLSFSGDEDLINALSLNVVQAAKENSFTVNVYDAHSGAGIASNVKVSGNMLVGVIHENVDVEFDPMANIEVQWNNKMKTFDLVQKSEVDETILHLVDNSTVFQVGANENEDVAVDIGDMSADALGITRVILTDRESAGRAITVLDAAISRVSSQRAKIGAYQNSLEHAVTNLTVTSTNLTDAESRIRDADMSKEMLNFTRLQILSQSGTAMLAQANQLPQSVLSLIGG